MQGGPRKEVVCREGLGRRVRAGRAWEGGCMQGGPGKEGVCREGLGRRVRAGKAYSAAHEQLDSPRVSRASHTRVLTHAHACTRASTREYSKTHALMLERVNEIHAQWTR